MTEEYARIDRRFGRRTWPRGDHESLVHVIPDRVHQGSCGKAEPRRRQCLFCRARRAKRSGLATNVTVTIVRIGPNNVRLGIDAPRDLNIVREELCSNEPVLNQPQSTSESGVRP